MHARYRWEPGGLHRAGPGHDGLRRELTAAITAVTAEAY
ncbi:hypothetical protein HDA36_000475 [Nocardiopsis composta]|uniref:Uncharacterized protein n=1 Tax=Nocardiopsis composta TaxID=157465 RepID=A0A7W8VBJ8_9ACTN|nr:hypothetical protein [Nocardiopsis composta]